jgi:hypothetical protein
MDIPWRTKLAPARFMDTHSVTLEGGPEKLRLEELESLLRSRAGTGVSWPARALFFIREVLGRICGWDSPEQVARVAPESYFWRMSEEEKAACLRAPGERDGPALILWNDDSSVCLEVLNATCQAFAVAYLNGRQVHLSIFVIETKWWSKYYLALIEPFRKYIVYPALTKWVEKSWAESLKQ